MRFTTTLEMNQGMYFLLNVKEKKKTNAPLSETSDFSNVQQPFFFLRFLYENIPRSEVNTENVSSCLLLNHRLNSKGIGT